MAHDCGHQDVVPVMAFYGMDWRTWSNVADADRQRMLDTMPYFEQIAVQSQDRKAVQALRGWQARLAWVEQYVDIEHEARRAVCLMHVDPLPVLWQRIKLQVVAGFAPFDPLAAAVQHPLYWALVELLQRALLTLELRDERGACGANALTQDQADQVWHAAKLASKAAKACHVPDRVAQLLVALKPLVVVESWPVQHQ